MTYSLPLTIITPSYNRADYLKRLFDSLCKQTNCNFQWLIIDDGSTDNTKEVVSGFKESRFVIEYHRKKNGGKHTALNYSHPYIMGELVCIVDSDDWLLPEAVEKIIYIKNRFYNDDVRMITFLKGKNREKAINTSFPNKPTISNHIDFRINGNRVGDCCEILDTEVLKEFPFPEHQGERFIGEGYLWNNAGFKYDTVYIPEVIYICEYLEGGLTKSGRRMRLMSPLGGMDNCNSLLQSNNNNAKAIKRKVNSKILIKESMLFVCYGKFARLKFKEVVSRAANPSLIIGTYIPGCMLYLYWKIKFKN